MTDLRKAAEMALEALESFCGRGYSALALSKRCDAAIKALRQALAQPQQEPVAWMYTSHYKGNEWFITRYQSELTTYKADKVQPLYTAPPKREWAGLTDAQVEKIAEYHGIDGLYETSRIDFYRAIEITLKEKNTNGQVSCT